MKFSSRTAATLVAGLSIASCRQEDSKTASLDAAKSADASQDASGVRALAAGSTPEQAAQNIQMQTIPSEVDRYFAGNLKVYWGSKAKTAKECERIISAAHMQLGDGVHDQTACWENIEVDDNSQKAVYLVKGSVADVHAALPEVLFRAYFEGVIVDLKEAIQLSPSNGLERC